MRKIRLHWSLHPLKDTPWYKAQTQRMTQDEIARELDIHYTLSASGRVFSPFQERLHVTTDPIPLHPQRPLYRVWDFGRTNAVLYAQTDSQGRIHLLHERVLGMADPATTAEQIQTALQDTDQLIAHHTPHGKFYGDIIDLCDPAGSYPDHRGGSADVDQLIAEGIRPQYEYISTLPTKERKIRGRKHLIRLMESCPGGEPAFLLFCPPNGQGKGSNGCPLLKNALLGGYRYKKDANGHITDLVHEKHPDEDVVDCLIYLALYLVKDGPQGDDPKHYRVVYRRGHTNPYTGY